MTKVFLAGATGFTGRAVLAQRTPLEFVLAVRAGSTRSNAGADPRARVVDYGDPESLARAMDGCDAVLSAIGTTRAQFAEGVSYETVDFGTTVSLLAAAKRGNVRHFVLMSSHGAGRPVGPYLAWKAKAERAVIASGVPYTIVRPSFLTGGGRRFPRIADAAIGALGSVPGLSGWAADLRSIPIEVVAWNFVRVLERGEDVGKVLSGRDLWRAWEGRPR